jgi:hypothetical protein
MGEEEWGEECEGRVVEEWGQKGRKMEKEKRMGEEWRKKGVRKA